MLDSTPASEEPTIVRPSNNPEGRSSGYDPAICQDVCELALRGATDEEIADHLGISTRTLYRWKNNYPELCQAIQSGKDLADERVERSLYQMATGTYVKEQQAHKVKTVTYDEGKRSAEVEEIKIVEVERYMPPDTASAIFWLKNRRSAKWKDKFDHNHNHTLTISGEFEGFIRGLLGKRQPQIIEADDAETVEPLPLAPASDATEPAQQPLPAAE